MVTKVLTVVVEAVDVFSGDTNGNSQNVRSMSDVDTSRIIQVSQVPDKDQEDSKRRKTGREPWWVLL